MHRIRRVRRCRHLDDDRRAGHDTSRFEPCDDVGVRVDPNDVPSGHDPMLTWEVNLQLPGDKRFAGYGTSGEGAFNVTRRLATTTGALSGVDWVEVTRALKGERAFR